MNKKAEFKDALHHGKREWKDLPHNGEEGQPCPAGCIMKQRVEAPHEIILMGDCRVPWSEDCCWKKEDKIRIERNAAN